MSTQAVPTWPHIAALTRADGTGEVTINGTNHSFSGSSVQETRAAMIALITQTAQRIERPVRVATSGIGGDWPLIIHPDGTVTQDLPSESPNSTPPSEPAIVPAAEGDSGFPRFPNPSDPLGQQAYYSGPNSSGLQQTEPFFTLPAAPPTASFPAEPVIAEPEGSAPNPNEQFSPEPNPVQPDPAVPAVSEAISAEASPTITEPSSTKPVPGFPVVSEPAQASPAVPATAKPMAQAPTTPIADALGAQWFDPPTRTAPPLNLFPEPDYSQGMPGVPIPELQPTVNPVQPSPVLHPATTTGGEYDARQSFLKHAMVEQPATQGVRGVIARAGIKVSPSDAERHERTNVLAVSQHWPGPRTIAIVNGKGGANKTPTTILLAATFSLHGGAGVLTWDNNQTRGTLGWRTEQGPHNATLLDLLPQAQYLLSAEARAADLAHYVHHQPRNRFDVLRSKPMALARDQRISSADVDAIHAVATKYYRLIFIDSGNDESDPMWLRMIDHTDQLVVATTTRNDHAEAGALLLEALQERDQRSAALAQNAIVVISQADPRSNESDITRVVQGYRGLAREAVSIPFDPAMVDGVLLHSALKPVTQRAWLSAAATVARGLPTAQISPGY